MNEPYKDSYSDDEPEDLNRSELYMELEICMGDLVQSSVTGQIGVVTGYLITQSGMDFMIDWGPNYEGCETVSACSIVALNDMNTGSAN